MNKQNTKKKPSDISRYIYRIITIALLISLTACAKPGNNQAGNKVSVTPAIKTTQGAAQTPTVPASQGSAQGQGTAGEAENTNTSVKTRDNSTAVLTTLNAGTFTVGKDIPKGRYVILGDESGNLFISDSSGMPYVNEILGGKDIGVRNVTTDIADGDTIQITGIKKVTFTPAETVLYKDKLTTGSWVVGIDFPAGRYDAASTGGNGNFTVTDNTGLLTVNEILGGGDFGVDKVTVDLKDGNIINISGMNEVKFTAR